MIQIQCFDKNGKELLNGDKIRYFRIEPDYQEEWGDNIPTGYYKHQVDTIIEWVEEIYNPDKYKDDLIIILPPYYEYDKEKLCELCGLPENISNDEFQEYVIDPICEVIGETLTLDELLKRINGFEIIK